MINTLSKKDYSKTKVKNGYLIQLKEMQIIVDENLYRQILSRLRSQESVLPEMVGYLIGQAKPIYVRVKCFICKKDIKSGTEQRFDYTRLSPSEPCHKKCYNKLLKQEKAASFIGDTHLGNVGEKEAVADDYKLAETINVDIEEPRFFRKHRLR